MFLIWWRELKRRRGGKEEVMVFEYWEEICGLKKNEGEKRKEKSYSLAVLGEERRRRRKEDNEEGREEMGWAEKGGEKKKKEKW